MRFVTRRRHLPILAVAALAALAAFGLPAAAQDSGGGDVPIPHLAPDKAGDQAAGGPAGDAMTIDQGDSSGAGADSGGDGTSGDEDFDTGDTTGADTTGGDAALAPPAPVDVGPPSDIRPGSYTLEARLEPNGPPLGAQVKWRIFGAEPGTDGHMPLLAEAQGGIAYLHLQTGTYFVHAAFGRAGATRKIDVGSPTGGVVVVLNAGGMRLLAVNGKDTPLGANDVSFDVYAPDEGGSNERFLLIQNAPPGHIISLNAGTYQVVCKYGDGNAVVRADIKVEAGKLTEATMFENAARLTLKLVEQHGGEALANTAWSIETLGGKEVVHSVGAFPSVILAAGDYTAKATHDGKVYQLNFTVAANDNRDVEVLTSQ